LDIQRYSDEQLQNVRGIIGQLFFLEKASTPNEFVSRSESILHNREFSIEEWWTLKRFMVGKYEKWIKEIDQKFAQAFDSNDNERDESEMKSNITRMFDKLMDQTLERGIERGIEQGIEQGKHDEKLEIARKLLRDGFISVEKIAEVTGLTVVEIQSLSE
jgi:predicted transposase/invertase (TIGR01784 family)